MADAARPDDPTRRDRGLRRRRRRARPDLARVVQRPHPARGHRRSARSPTRCRGSAAPSGPSCWSRSSGCTATATPCSSKYSDPSGHWGPEGRAWVKRLDAETLRARWLVGVDAPPQDALVDVWREAEQLFEDFGHVHELATVRADPGRHPARDRRHRRRPASWATRPARSRTGSAPSRCSTGSGPGQRAGPRRGRGVRHADRPRGRDPRAGRRGPVQRRDRQAAVHQRQDRLGARLQHPRQAQRLRTHRGGRHRPAARPDRLTGVGTCRGSPTPRSGAATIAARLGAS